VRWEASGSGTKKRAKEQRKQATPRIAPAIPGLCDSEQEIKNIVLQVMMGGGFGGGG
jgi:hypothetical protein